jgi:hypothetical protein
MVHQIQTVLIHGSRIRFYVLVDAVGKGMNLTVSCLADSLEHVKPTASELRIQCDSGSENNNFGMYVFVSMLIQCGAFKAIEVHRLPPG